MHMHICQTAFPWLVDSLVGAWLAPAQTSGQLPQGARPHSLLIHRTSHSRKNTLPAAPQALPFCSISRGLLLPVQLPPSSKQAQRHLQCNHADMFGGKNMLEKHPLYRAPLPCPAVPSKWQQQRHSTGRALLLSRPPWCHSSYKQQRSLIPMAAQPPLAADHGHQPKRASSG